MSRETGLMWTVELVLAAEQQGLRVSEVPVVLSETHDRAPSRFTLRDARIAVREIVRLALQKDDFAEDEVDTGAPIVGERLSAFVVVGISRRAEVAEARNPTTRMSTPARWCLRLRQRAVIAERFVVEKTLAHATGVNLSPVWVPWAGAQQRVGSPRSHRVTARLRRWPSR